MTLFSTLIPFLAAGLMAVLAFLLLDGIDFSFSRSASSRLDKFGGQQASLSDKLGDGLIARLGLDLAVWAADLRWAQLGGEYDGDSVSAILGQSIMYVGMGVLGVIGLGVSPFTIGAIGFLAYLPYMRLHNTAEKVRSNVRRSLPEAAAFVAGEMAAGVSADQALIRAGRLPGPLGVILREAGEIAGTSNRLMLSRAGVRGVFRDQVDVCLACRIFRLLRLKLIWLGRRARKGRPRCPAWPGCWRVSIAPRCAGMPQTWIINCFCPPPSISSSPCWQP